MVFSSLRKKPQVTQILHPNISNLQNAFGNSTISAFNIKNIITYLIYFFLTLAIMQPQLVNKKVSIINKGRDIIIAADLSGSMRALDFSTKKQCLLQQTLSNMGEFGSPDIGGGTLWSIHTIYKECIFMIYVLATYQ